MSPIIGSQLSDNVLDMKIDGRLGNSQCVRYLFVAMTISNQPQNLQFSSRKILISEMLREPGCHLRRHLPPSGVNGPDQGEQLGLRHALERVTCGAGLAELD